MCMCVCMLACVRTPYWALSFLQRHSRVGSSGLEGGIGSQAAAEQSASETNLLSPDVMELMADLGIMEGEKVYRDILYCSTTTLLVLDGLGMLAWAINRDLLKLGVCYLTCMTLYCTV